MRWVRVFLASLLDCTHRTHRTHLFRRYICVRAHTHMCTHIRTRKKVGTVGTVGTVIQIQRLREIARWVQVGTVEVGRWWVGGGVAMTEEPPAAIPHLFAGAHGGLRPCPDCGVREWLPG